MPKAIVCNVPLTHAEIDQLASWHRECEKRLAEMREYEMANAHKDRTYLFEGLQKSAAYREASKVSNA